MRIPRSKTICQVPELFFGGFRESLTVIKNSKSSFCRPYQGQP